MTPYVFFLDLDGTMMVQGKISKIDRDAVVKAQTAGHQVWINTGRSYCNIPENLTKEMAVDGVVAGLGADVRMGEKRLYSNIIPLSLVDQIVEIMKDCCYLVEGEDAMYQRGGMIPERCFLVSPDIPFSRQFPDARISKFSLYKSPPQSVIEKLKPLFSYYQFPAYHEFCPVGQNKATGMERAMNVLGIPMERSIAIGDSRNDLDMLQAAGISVAMGNAPDEVKELCDYVTASVTEGGVAKAIEHFLSQGEILIKNKQKKL